MGDRKVQVGVVLGLGALSAALLYVVSKRPCPCKDKLGEAEASADAIALAGAMMPPLRFDTEVIPTEPAAPKPRTRKPKAPVAA